MISKRKTQQGERKARKSKSSVTRAKKAGVKKGKASAGEVQAEEPIADDGTEPTAAALAPARPKSEEEMSSLIKGLDAPSLHDDDIAATLKHLNSVVAFRRAAGQPGAVSKKALSGKCYLKSAGDPIVSIYEGPYHVDSMSEDSAIALGIPRCGS
jgi:hypothetical protein